MAQTQKMYLGGVPVIQNYFGENPIVVAGAIARVIPILSIEYLVVAGGAGGGADGGANNAGGGGAGRFVSSSYTLNPSSTLDAVIGTGGAIAANGNDSSLIGSGLNIQMRGGGRGATSGNGIAGGSGGGAAVPNNTGGSASNGALSSDLIGIGTAGGNSGGTDASAGAGGGANTQWLDGITYCVGGPSATGGSASTTAGSGGHGGKYLAPTAATAGRNGIVKIRYAGGPVASGGTITESGGYTYHTFTSDGTFTYPS